MIVYKIGYNYEKNVGFLLDIIKCILVIRKRKDNEDLIMRSTTKNITFIAATIILILISAFFITKTVRGQVDHELAACEKYYQVLEQEYVSEIRAYLNEHGFENSGVTLTRIIDEQGIREYQITLHHKYLEKLSAEEREAIFAAIKNLAFENTGCIFQINLLV